MNLKIVRHCAREELEEVMKLVKPQHFLPVHGEYAFLCAHAQLARDIGIRDTSVIRNGQYLGVAPKRNGKTISSGSMQLLGEAKLQMFYNDGGRVRALLLSLQPKSAPADSSNEQLEGPMQIATKYNPRSNPSTQCLAS
jgi:hypothetical protein